MTRRRVVLARLRLALPWWMFRATRPPEFLVLDWRYLHGWGRAEVPDREPRHWADRLRPEPQHVCGPVECWVLGDGPALDAGGVRSGGGCRPDRLTV